MTQNNELDPVGIFSNFLRNALNDQLDPAATTFVEMLAEDAVIEFPYAPPGGVTKVEGKANIAQYVSGVGDLFEFGDMTLAARHDSNQSDTIILEFSCTGTGVKTGEPYNQKYISVISVRDGKIAHYNDYWNPLIALDAMGGTYDLSSKTVGETV
jgi:ketosteroid isomerase-like protein